MLVSASRPQLRHLFVPEAFREKKSNRKAILGSVVPNGLNRTCDPAGAAEPFSEPPGGGGEWKLSPTLLLVPGVGGSLIFVIPG